MKKLLFLIALAVPAAAMAQDAQQAALDAANTVNAAAAETVKVKPNYWTNSISFDFGINQTALVNWSAGGYHTVNFGAGIDGQANYAKDLMTWDNRLQLNYGFLWSYDKKNLLQKSNDRIYLESKWAYKTSKDSKWSYSAGLDFRSQFSNTYDNYVQDDPGDPHSTWHGDLKSGFLSPAYANLALGMEWKPCNWFNLNLAPLTGGLTVVTNPYLRKNYGMKLGCDENDPEYKAVSEGGDQTTIGGFYKSVLPQFGFQLKANFVVAVNDNFKFESQFVYFTDYLDGPFYNTYRINWDNGITWQPAKFFKIGLNTWLIYDTNIRFDDITYDPDHKRSKVQFKEFLSLNFTYSIASKK